MSVRELDAAGVHGEQLRASYEHCRRLFAHHGRTYYLATRLLPASKRPYVHALYGFARYADDIVDDLSPDTTPQQRADHLGRWGEAFQSDLARGHSIDPVGQAVVDTAVRWDIPHEHFAAFLHSMTMDLTVTSYETYDDLYDYVYGSAGVIGLLLVPILEPVAPQAAARALELGVAFQLANFIRDVGEDLQRGRVYLPLAELAQFGVTRADLERRVVTTPVREALAFQVARVRALESAARPGIALLHPSSRPCIDAARILYCDIVDAVAASDYQVFDRRAVVSRRRRLAVALPAWRRALAARRRYGSGTVPDA